MKKGVDEFGAMVLPRNVWLALDERLRRVEHTLRYAKSPQDIATIRQLRTAVTLASIGGDVSIL